MDDLDELRQYADLARRTAAYALRNAYGLTSAYLPLFTPYVAALSPCLSQLAALSLQSLVGYAVALYLALLMLRYTTSALYRSVVWMFKVLWIMTVFTALILAAALLLQKID